MLNRSACPITGDTNGLVEKIRLPYDSGFLGGWTERRKWGKWLRGLDYRVWYVPATDFYFQESVFDDDEEALRRENIASRLAKNTEQNRREYSLTELSHKAEDAMLIRLLHPGKSCPKVFDFGMATGEWALMAKAYGSEVWGTDLDPRAPDACAAHGIRFTTLEEAPEGGFDFINADQVFEHLPQPLEIGRILANKLAPGGILKLTTPRDRRIEAKLERLKQGGYDDLAVFEREFFPLSPLSHINLFTARSLIELGERLGLEPFRVPLRQCYATMTGFHSARQWNRNLYNPLKRYLAKGTWQFFRKPA